MTVLFDEAPVKEFLKGYDKLLTSVPLLEICGRRIMRSMGTKDDNFFTDDFAAKMTAL